MFGSPTHSVWQTKDCSSYSKRVLGDVVKEYKTWPWLGLFYSQKFNKTSMKDTFSKSLRVLHYDNLFTVSCFPNEAIDYHWYIIGHGKVINVTTSSSHLSFRNQVRKFSLLVLFVLLIFVLRFGKFQKISIPIPGVGSKNFEGTKRCIWPKSKATGFSRGEEKKSLA